MNFNTHSHLENTHAFLGASRYHWINYDDDKMIERYSRSLAVQKGTKLHDFAEQCILLKQKLPRSKKTLNSYVNDAIGFRMTPEQTLYFSDNCFGTADAISFYNKLLRIHDLKTGITPAKMEQLEVYSALFCLEYDVQPKDIDIELRIYQLDEIAVYEPQADSIYYIIDKIKRFDKILNRIKIEEGVV